MGQEYVKIRATNPDGATANITELCRSITWSGDWRNAARMLSYSPVANQDDPRLPRAPTELGGSARFWHGSELLMDAYALERTRDSLGNTIDVTAYDKGLYLTRNSAFLRVEGQTPEGVTASLCGQYGIEAGTLTQTGVALTRNFLGVPLYKIIMTLYTLAADQTGKQYRVRFRGAKLEVVEMKQSEESVVLVPGSNLLSCVSKESASAMTNSVAIYDDQYKLVSTQEDGEAVKLYGLMRAAIRAGAYAAIACLTWFAGLRIHECFRIDTATAAQALREGAITIKGKGGKIRTVPINEAIRGELGKFLAVTPRGHKLFVPDDVQTHNAIAQLQQYIYKVRPAVQDEDSARPMTHHGLRHSYAARTWQELVGSGVSPFNASLRVSQLLGHERPDVTQVYLASVEKEDG